MTVRALLRALDALGQELALANRRGRLLWMSTALRQTVMRSDGPRLRLAMRELTRTLCRAPSAQLSAEVAAGGAVLVNDLELSDGWYRIKGSWVGTNSRGTGGAVLLAVVCPPPTFQSDEVLQERFGLSAREGTIVRLLMEGRTNAEIGRALFLSPHTVRHHLERIFAKLGIRSRAEVATRILRRTHANGPARA